MPFVNGVNQIPLGNGVMNRASGAYHPQTGRAHRNNSPRLITGALPYHSWKPRIYYHFLAGEEKLEYDTTANNLIGREALFESEFPEFSKLTLGTSFQGKDIYGYRLGPVSRKHFVIVCGVHGNENDGANGAFKAMEILAEHPDFSEFRDEWTILFIPALNPDGWKLGTRNLAEIGPNGRTVNLNRVWDWFWAEYVETAFESKGTAPGASSEAQALLSYHATGNSGGPVEFGFLLDMHANEGVGARYMSRDRVWRGIGNDPSVFLPVPTGYIATYIDWYVLRMAQAMITTRIRAGLAPDLYTRYLKSRFRPHLHSYFSSLGIPSMAVEEVKVAAANGIETFQSACNYRLDYILACAMVCTASKWTVNDGVLVEGSATNILTNAEWEQWQPNDVRPGNYTLARGSIERLTFIPEYLEPSERLFDDSGEVLRFTSNTDLNLSAASEYTRAAMDNFNSVIAISPNTANVLQIKVGSNPFTGTLLTLSLHTQRYGTALTHGGTDAVDILGGGTAAPSTGAVANVRRINTSTGIESSVGSLGTARMFHASADNLLSDPSDANKRSFVFGGYDSGGTRLTSIEIWNPNTNTASGASGTFPAGLADATAAYYPPTNTVYIFGGTTAVSTTGVSTIYVYNVATQGLSTHGTTMSKALSHVAASYSPTDGKIYIFGGQESSGDMNDEIYSFDPSDGTWAVESIIQNLDDDEDSHADEGAFWEVEIGRWGAAPLIESSDDPGPIYVFGGRLENTSGSLSDEVYVFDTLEKTIGISRESEYGYFRFSTAIGDSQMAVQYTDDFTTLDESVIWSDPGDDWELSGGAAVGTGPGPLILNEAQEFRNAIISIDVSWTTVGDPTGDFIFRAEISGSTVTDGYIVRYDGTSGDETWHLIRVVSSVETIINSVDVSGDSTKQVTALGRSLEITVENADPVRVNVVFNSQSIMDYDDIDPSRIKTAGKVAFRR